MKTLELKHLAPYLPYELNGQFEVTDIVPNAKQEIRDKKLTASSIEMFLLYCKPILRPLSDLIKEIEHNGEKIVLTEAYDEHPFDQFKGNPLFWPYDMVQVLFKYHFDVFNLIEQGFAIDINTLQSA